ncbi:uncharacterized protein LOC143041454 isoform X2 [Oratosquilla oratoria]|uniref:uncharacterized protein LOC143041454 isoform X2 n=1 Tax=Oratosquilla oratoria TaxID=337810 RepID=UPI003F75C2C5
MTYYRLYLYYTLLQGGVAMLTCPNCNHMVAAHPSACCCCCSNHAAAHTHPQLGAFNTSPPCSALSPARDVPLTSRRHSLNPFTNCVPSLASPADTSTNPFGLEPPTSSSSSLGSKTLPSPHMGFTSPVCQQGSASPAPQPLATPHISGHAFHFPVVQSCRVPCHGSCRLPCQSVFSCHHHQQQQQHHCHHFHHHHHHHHNQQQSDCATSGSLQNHEEDYSCDDTASRMHTSGGSLVLGRMRNGTVVPKLNIPPVPGFTTLDQSDSQYGIASSCNIDMPWDSCRSSNNSASDSSSSSSSIQNHNGFFSNRNLPSPCSVTMPTSSFPGMQWLHWSESDDRRVLMATKKALETCGWYYAHMSWQQAEVLLRASAIGTFIIRNSADQRYQYSLSVQTERGPTSVRIQFTRGKFRLDSDSRMESSMPEFSSVIRLIEYYISVNQKLRKHVWVDANGKVYSPITIRQPLTRTLPSLKHLCRLAIHRGLSRNFYTPRLPESLNTYLQDYPFKC